MSDALDRLMWVTRALREHCPWTRQLTHHELTEYLIEEAHEAVEVIEAHPDDFWNGTRTDQDDGATSEQHLKHVAANDELRRELGDVLFQVVLHSAIAEQRLAPDVAVGSGPGGGFTLDTVAEAITEKMLRRNPHVFTPEGHLQPAERLATSSIADVEKTWESIKHSERAASAEPAESDKTAHTAETLATVFTLPAGLPALAAAAKAIDRAARQQVNPLPPPVKGANDQPDIDFSSETALGESLFNLVRHARARGLDPERALRMYMGQMRR